MPYYAIKNGKDGPKIYDNWPECQAASSGVSKAVFKKFKSLVEAERFISEPDKVPEDVIMPENSVTVYTDGSWTENQGGGFAAVFVHGTEDRVEKIIYGPSIKEEKIRNVGGELEAVETAIVDAMQSGYDGITVIHDYSGVQKWADGEWKGKADDAMEYISFMEEVRNHIQIRFIHVDGHSGVKYNEIADEYAKKGARLSATKTKEFE